MFNSTVLDVFIGLILVFLLYSLLVTILGEIVCNWIGLRSRILRVSIEKMLNDGYYKSIGKSRYQGLWYWIQRFFLKEFSDFKHSFAGKFYNFAAIKYLSMRAGEQTIVISQTKPSYLSAEMFAESLIQLLKDKGVGSTDIEKILFCLKYNTLFIQPDSLKHILDMVKASGNDVNLLKDKFKVWYNETQDRATGWHKGKLQLILFWLGFIVAVTFNVDAIKIARILSKDKEARSQLVSMGIELAKDSARYKDFITPNGDSGHSQTVLDSGYARVTRDINEASLVLGLGWNKELFLEKDNIEIDRNKDSVLFHKAKKYAGSLAKQNTTFVTEQLALQASIANIEDIKQRLNELAVELLDSAKDTTQVKHSIDSAKLKLKQAQTKKMRDSAAFLLVSKRINDIHHTLDTLTGSELDAISAIDYGRKAIPDSTLKKITDSILKVPDSSRVMRDSIPADSVASDSIAKLRAQIEARLQVDSSTLVVTGFSKYSWPVRVWCVVKEAFGSYSFFGFFITGLMISLGAPFWFDLLRKVVSIRSEGVKPEEKKKEDVTETAIRQSNQAGVVQVAPAQADIPIATALRIYADQVALEKGVVSVSKGYFQENGEVKSCLQVNVEDNATAITIRNKYKDIRIGHNEKMFLNVLVTGKPTLSADFDGLTGNRTKAICNSKSPINIGSFGCLVKKRDDPGTTYLLSCYHVMNADRIWDNREKVRQTIIRNENVIIANSYEGYLNNSMDIALAELTPAAVAFYANNNPCERPARPVGENDVFRTRVFIQGASTTDSVGIIVNDSRPETFKYPLGRRRFLSQQLDDLIIISHKQDGVVGLRGTTVGDSGSIVLDEDQRPIGIVVGSDLLHTYAIKVNTVFRLIGLELITTLNA